MGRIGGPAPDSYKMEREGTNSVGIVRHSAAVTLCACRKRNVAQHRLDAPLYYYGTAEEVNSGSREKRLRRRLRGQLQKDRENEGQQERRSLKRPLNTANRVAVGEATLPIWRHHFKTLLNRQAPSDPELEHVDIPTDAINEEP
ncbi:hypothetical protein RB195_023952 [Necator americanus]|uniref:Uncharacterized protein n=1 Tax=Necator americanus TaxID=51031 RepID=A0ABR1ELD4_NECAM